MFECAETFGIHNVEEYSWKDLFDQEACMRCGRCVEVCPAFNTDKPLKPRDVIQNIRTYLEEKAKFAMDADGSYRIIPDEEYTGPALIGDVSKKKPPGPVRPVWLAWRPVRHISSSSRSSST